MDKFLVSVTVVFLAIVLIVLFSALYAFPTMWLWNGILVTVFSGVKEVTFWQAWGLNILAGIFFKSSVSSSTSDK